MYITKLFHIKRALCLLPCLSVVKASMAQCGVRSSGALALGGLHAGLCHAFLAVYFQVVVMSNAYRPATKLNIRFAVMF